MSERDQQEKPHLKVPTGLWPGLHPEWENEVQALVLIREKLKSDLLHL